MDYWEKNRLIKPQQYIVCAACRLDNIIIAGARHFDKVMRSQMAAMPKMSWAQADQGFIDQFGDFLTREEAMKIAQDNKQRIDLERNGGDIVLFSEGLY
jgi:hypothetical protein